MKILVTGGAGYIGSHAVYQLIEQNYQVVVVDNLVTGSSTNLHPEAKYYRVDLRDYQTLKNVFETEQDIRVIMHFAASALVGESVNKPLEYFDNNLNGLKNLLDLANQFDIKHFVFSSTAAVYGNPKKIPISEADCQEPINPYGWSKLAGEALLKAWAKTQDAAYVILRYFNVAGAHENGLIGLKSNNLSNLLPVIIDHLINDKTFNIYGNDYQTKDGTCIRDYVHVMDLIEGHILALKWMLATSKSEIFNLGSGIGHSVLEVCQTIETTLGVKLKTNINNRRSGDPEILLSNIEKAQKLLNWQPKRTLEQMIETEYHFRKNFVAKEENN